MIFSYRIILVTHLLFLTVSPCISSDRPLKTTVRTASSGLLSAGFGWGLHEVANRSCANYSLDIPTVITHTGESRLLLIAASAAGALLVKEKILHDTKTPFDTILPDNGKKYQIGKALEIGIKAGTTFALLTTVGKQSTLDAALCTVFGLGVLTCLETDETKN